MPDIIVRKTYIDGENLKEQDLDGIRDSIQFFFNSTKISDTNIQTGGIATANFTDSSITRSELPAVGQQVSISSTHNANVITSGTLTTCTDGTTDLSATLTTTGRPVFISLFGVDGAGGAPDVAEIEMPTTNGNSEAEIAIIRDSTVIGRWEVRTDVGGSVSVTARMPVGGIKVLDVVTSGTYVYKIQARKINGTSVALYNIKMVAYEL